MIRLSATNSHGPGEDQQTVIRTLPGGGKLNYNSSHLCLLLELLLLFLFPKNVHSENGMQLTGPNLRSNDSL